MWSLNSDIQGFVIRCPSCFPVGYVRTLGETGLSSVFSGKRPPTPKGLVVAMWGAVMKQSNLFQPRRHRWRHSEVLELPPLPSINEEPLPSSVSRDQVGNLVFYPHLAIKKWPSYPLFPCWNSVRASQCKQKASIRPRISQNYTPNVHVSIEKSLIIPRSMGISH